MRCISTRAGDNVFARASIDDEAFEEYDEGGDTIAPEVEDVVVVGVSLRSWREGVDMEMGEEDFWSVLVLDGWRLWCRLDSGVGEVCALDCVVVSVVFR